MSDTLDALKQGIERHSGYRNLRPLQARARALAARMAGGHSLVVMPTGGGKSLCYQAPAVLRGGTTVVVSPLISLMKDQVDSLKACGVPAIQINSALSSGERTVHEYELLQGEVRLLFVSPERLALDDFCNLLHRIDVRTFAIDEAHCISHWGHDFRPEYRQLKRLKEIFPKASVHGFTATATERVRRDVVEQLGLRQPEILVGNFDRPNLNYRVLPKMDETRQVLEVLDRHKGEAGIIYCIRRRDVDELADTLKKRRLNAMAYHAGLPAEERKTVQDAFAAEKCDLIVATVAFGMGIDRSNIRFVMHTAMPKSVEHYQQETGRAGRDGLEAECVLLYSARDAMTWRRIIEKSAQENNASPEYLASSLQHMQHMDRYAQGAACRHKALVEYFGQRYESETCQACDLCLGDTEPLPDADVIAQKILSCVARVEQRFGVKHVVDVLRGAGTEKVRGFRHEQLSTYGLLKDCTQIEVRNWIYQLIGQGVLVQDGGERPVLKLNEKSWEVMKKARTVRLLRPMQRQKGARAAQSKADTASWEGVDRELFEELRKLRRDLARDQGVPTYIIFGDATLRELARRRPSNRQRMRAIYGIGDKKLRDFGDLFLDAIVAHCRQHGVALDIATATEGFFPTEEEDRSPAGPIDRSAPLADAMIVAQKILSCIARLGRPCRLSHVVRVLRGL